MTTLISWCGVDQRGPASIYIAADSRVTWPGNGMWDFARKVFAAKRHPDILGYCGHAFFPTQTLGQLIELIDAGLLVSENMPLEGERSRWYQSQCILRIRRRPSQRQGSLERRRAATRRPLQ